MHGTEACRQGPERILGELQIVGDGYTVKLGCGREGDRPPRAQIEESSFNTRGLMHPNWKSTQTSVEACKKLRFLKENHEDSAGA